MVRRIACSVLFLGMGMSLAAQQSDDTKTPASAAAPPSADKVKHASGKMTAPILIHSVDPSFTEEALKHKVYNGMVLVALIIDEQGMPQNVHVIEGKGMGLDEEAVKAVQQYRFKPAKRDGVPVKVDMHIKVRFQHF